MHNLLIIVLIILILYFLYTRTEGFDALLTVDSPTMVNVDYLESAPRNVRFNKSGGIMYVTNQRMPNNCLRMNCPSYVNESVTLGKNNYCWKC